MLERGEIAIISYPMSTHVGSVNLERVERREIVVHHVRDLVANPLSVGEFMRRPYLLRSRWLIKAYEPDRNQFRQFYLGSSLEWKSPAVLRVGLYEPDSTRPVKVFGRGFEATPEDRAVLIRALRVWSRHDLGDAKLMVFADDLRFCG
jgi:hypothetical protein